MDNMGILFVLVIVVLTVLLAVGTVRWLMLHLRG